MILYLHLEVSQVLEVAHIHGTSTTTSGGESTGSSPLTSLLKPLTSLLKRFMEYRTGNASLITTTIYKMVQRLFLSPWSLVCLQRIHMGPQHPVHTYVPHTSRIYPLKSSCQLFSTNNDCSFNQHTGLITWFCYSPSIIHLLGKYLLLSRDALDT